MTTNTEDNTPPQKRVRVSGGGPYVAVATYDGLRVLAARHRLSLGRTLDCVTQFSLSNPNQFTNWLHETNQLEDSDGRHAYRK